METKTVKPIIVYYKHVVTNIKEIGKFVGNVPQQLIQEALASGYKISGPQIWHYEGMDGNPDTDFDLDICLPFDNYASGDSQNIKMLDEFQCFSEIVKGPWSNLKEGYKSLVENISTNNMKPTLICREIYHTVDFNNPEKCLTEIQMGVK